MKFTDYPKDLQRIVELTPEGWYADAGGVSESSDDGVSVFWHFGANNDGHYNRTEYNQCRAQWLAEKAEVDWRGLCELLVSAGEALDQYLPKRPARKRIGAEKYSGHLLAVDHIRDCIKEARKELEQTK